VLRSPNNAERASAAARKIIYEGQVLLRMIMSLLDISKADEGQLVPSIHALDANEMVHGALEPLEDRATEAGVSIATHVKVSTLWADPDLMPRVLVNLADNAIRHAPEDSTVRIDVVAHDGRVEIRVADAGPGIPEELREAVFERYQCGAVRTSMSRGLGLTFCKLAVEAHGGHIWIENASPGTAFCLSVPQ